MTTTEKKTTIGNYYVPGNKVIKTQRNITCSNEKEEKKFN